MEILLISECFFIIALIIFLIASLRIISFKSVSMGLIGTSSATLIISLVILVIGEMFKIGFFKDIAIALLVLSIVGTIGFSVALKKGD